MHYLAQVSIQEKFLNQGGFLVPSRLDQIGFFISNFLNNALILAGIILLVYMVIGGIGMISSAGSENSESLEKGKKAITTALIGFIVVFCAYWIVQLISKLTGVSGILQN